MYTLAAILAIDHFRTRPVSREIGLPRPNGLAIAPVLTSRRWGEVSGRRELSVTARRFRSPSRRGCQRGVADRFRWFPDGGLDLTIDPGDADLSIRRLR